MDISLIWAMTENRVIGADNTLPWRLPKDMRHFMDTTMGKPLIMGRKNYESMKAPLPGRTNIVMTRNANYQTPPHDNVVIVLNMAAALAVARDVARRDGVDEIMIIGGADVYQLALPIATKLYVTTVHATVDGDVHFPDLDLAQWYLQDEVKHAADERHFADFTISTYNYSTPDELRPGLS